MKIINYMLELGRNFGSWMLITRLEQARANRAKLFALDSNQRVLGWWCTGQHLVEPDLITRQECSVTRAQGMLIGNTIAIQSPTHPRSGSILTDDLEEYDRVASALLAKVHPTRVLASIFGRQQFEHHVSIWLGHCVHVRARGQVLVGDTSRRIQTDTFPRVHTGGKRIKEKKKKNENTIMRIQANKQRVEQMTKLPASNTQVHKTQKTTTNNRRELIHSTTY